MFDSKTNSFFLILGSIIFIISIFFKFGMQVFIGYVIACITWNITKEKERSVREVIKLVGAAVVFLPPLIILLFVGFAGLGWIHYSSASKDIPSGSIIGLWIGVPALYSIMADVAGALVGVTIGLFFRR